MGDILLLASLMCASFGNLNKEINNLEDSGIDSFHIDIMDGLYVPNFGMGLQDLEFISKNTSKNIDVHLMIKNPGRYIDLFAKLGSTTIYIHPESDDYLGRTLQSIIDNKVKVGIALNPTSSIDIVKPYIDLVDYILIMTVNPGFAGQKYQEYAENKIIDLLNYKDNRKFEIIVDGAITIEKIKSLKKYGVKGFVLGTSSLFGQDKSYQSIIKEIRSL